jgi:hypothetical protein
MAPGGALPKFELRGDTLTAVPLEGVVRPKSAPTKASPGPLFDAPVEPAAAKAQPAEPVAHMASAVTVSNPFSIDAPRNAGKPGWVKGLFGSISAVLSDAFSGRRNRARRRAVRATVQGELGLDSVRPLHNDLSGADFEVVAAPVGKPAMVVRPSAAPRPEPSPASSVDESSVQSRPDTRLLGAKD